MFRRVLAPFKPQRPPSQPEFSHTDHWMTYPPAGPLRGMDDGSHPEGVNSGLQGPSHVRQEWIEAERALKEREAQSTRAGAISRVAWIRAQLVAAEAKAEAAEAKVKGDLNPLGRSGRHADWRLEAAHARRDLATLAEDASEAIDRARALGVKVEELAGG